MHLLIIVGFILNLHAVLVYKINSLFFIIDANMLKPYHPLQMTIPIATSKH